MVALQILNKILKSKDFSIIINNNYEEKDFIGYEDEFSFLFEFYKKYNKVPDEETFIDKFRDFDLVDVTESDDYLISTLNEEILYYRTVGVVQKIAKLLETDSNKAVEYLQSKIPYLTIQNNIIGKDIINEAEERFKIYMNKINEKDVWSIPSGFPELDNILYGWARGEELVVFFARTGQGKSWVLVKTMANAWELGNDVAYISPEMSPVKIGYRFDTVFNNFSNSDLIRGENINGYETYINKLKERKNKFIVATPLDFGKKITITKIKNFIINNNIKMLGIDGITYLTDERYKKGDTKTISLTNISEDLISLSVELKIPILVVVQSNRGGVKNEDQDGTPELENIRDSDGIAQNATKVIALRQTGDGLEFGIKKNRDGITNTKVIYYWDIDKGIFKYIPSSSDSVSTELKDKKIKEIKNKFDDAEDVF